VLGGGGGLGSAIEGFGGAAAGYEFGGVPGGIAGALTPVA